MISTIVFATVVFLFSLLSDRSHEFDVRPRLGIARFLIKNNAYSQSPEASIDFSIFLVCISQTVPNDVIA
jgi:hypothetical protein